jgi:hypothetical protein
MNKWDGYIMKSEADIAFERELATLQAETEANAKMLELCKTLTKKPNASTEAYELALKVTYDTRERERKSKAMLQQKEEEMIAEDETLRDLLTRYRHWASLQEDTLPNRIEFLELKERIQQRHDGFMNDESALGQFKDTAESLQDELRRRNDLYEKQFKLFGFALENINKAATTFGEKPVGTISTDDYTKVVNWQQTLLKDAWEAKRNLKEAQAQINDLQAEKNSQAITLAALQVELDHERKETDRARGDLYRLRDDYNELRAKESDLRVNQASTTAISSTELGHVNQRVADLEHLVLQRDAEIERQHNDYTDQISKLRTEVEVTRSKNMLLEYTADRNKADHDAAVKNNAELQEQVNNLNGQVNENLISIMRLEGKVEIARVKYEAKLREAQGAHATTSTLLNQYIDDVIDEGESSSHSWAQRSTTDDDAIGTGS